MRRSRYDYDLGSKVIGSLAELLAALDLETVEDLEAWADALVEPYVSLRVDSHRELNVSLDDGSSAALDYPFSVEFFVETLEDLDGQAEGRSVAYWLYDYPAEGRRWQRVHRADCPHVDRRSETDTRVTWMEVEHIPPGAFGCSTCGTTGAEADASEESAPDLDPLVGRQVTATVLVDEEDVEPWAVTGTLNARWVETFRYTAYTVNGHPVKPETVEAAE